MGSFRTSNKQTIPNSQTLTFACLEASRPEVWLTFTFRRKSSLTSTVVVETRRYLPLPLLEKCFFVVRCQPLLHQFESFDWNRVLWNVRIGPTGKIPELDLQSDPH